MAQQKKGLITRLLEGKEKSEEYARSTLPTNRWQLFWDIFKGNFGKLVKVNLLILLFCLPLAIILVVSLMYSESVGVTYPFGANLGIGYPAAPAMQGISEWLSLQGDLFMYIGVLLTSIIAAVGLAGGMYVVRNMVWTEGIFVSNDFWRGVKLNFKNAVQTALFFCMILLVSTSLINFSEFALAAGEVERGAEVMLRISMAVSYVFLALAAMMSLWMIALGVNYNMGFLTLLRNSFLMTIGTLPQTIFFGVIALLPFALFIIGSGFLLALAVMVVLFFGVAYALLVWLDFAQWVFDKYINPKIEGAKVGRGIYNKDGSSALTGDDSAASIEYQRMLLSHGRSRLVARPIKPIDDSTQVYELPQAFTREDLQKLRKSKEVIIEDTEAYAEEHKNDLRYVEYNRQFDEREKALQEQDEKKGKKKRGKKLKAKQNPEEEDKE
jgi:uncharacterized membrane protein YesL